MKWIDLPPVWLAGFLLVTWMSPWNSFLGLFYLLGWLCLFAGVVLWALAMPAFHRAKTTIIPRHPPAALITDGIYRFSRNPIYLADVLFLLAAALILGRLLGLILVPAFVLLLDRRFIRGEEAGLRAAFGAEFETYVASTRRWL